MEDKDKIREFIEDKKNEIATYQKSLEDKYAELNSQLLGLNKDFDDTRKVLNDFTKKPNNARRSKADELNHIFSKVQEYDSNIKKSEERIRDFKKEIYGSDENDKNSFKTKINSLIADYQNLNDDWEIKFLTLSDKIEGLLPGATATGLAKAYQDQKKKYKYPKIIWSSVFITTMILMIIVSFLTIKDTYSISEIFINTFSRAPFYVPTIWLALFASKRQSQNARLQEEYAHKESLTKSYEGYKREIENLPDSTDKTEIEQALIKVMIETANVNPSNTLEKSFHNDNPPSFLNLFNGDKNKSK